MNRYFKLIAFCLAFMLTFPVFAQEAKDSDKKDEGYKFTEVTTIKVTPVKDQYRSGTCWSFAGLGFLESELLRMGKGEHDLSEMWIVRKCYEDKAKQYVRWHGKINFGGGGAFHDVFSVVKNYGILTEKQYKGLNYGDTAHIHGEVDAICKSYVEAVIKNANKKISPAWFQGYCGLLDAYLGKVDANPMKQESLGLNMDDYVEITSFTHHPFYSKFIIEVEDNWMLDEVYNVKLDEMIEIIDNALNNGYPVAWGADVSEKGFSWTKGIAIVPEENRSDLDGLERAKWEKLSAKEKNDLLYSFDKPVIEKQITQELRQEGFDNYQTTDDHGMVIVGIAKDQNGNKFYKVKNSWNTTNPYNGYFYASEAFVKYKTIDIAVHKGAIPKNIKKSLDLK